MKIHTQCSYLKGHFAVISLLPTFALMVSKQAFEVKAGWFLWSVCLTIRKKQKTQ